MPLPFQLTPCHLLDVEASMYLSQNRCPKSEKLVQLCSFAMETIG